MGYGEVGIDDWQERCHGMAVNKGWWPDEQTDEQWEAARELATIAVAHLNLSHRLEAVRRGDPMPWRAVDAEGLVATLTPQQVDDLARMALIHSEVTEAVECIVGGHLGMTGGGYTGPPGADGRATIAKPEGAVVELADVMIRIMDWCGRKGLALENAVRSKYYFNDTRPPRHGGKLA